MAMQWLIADPVLITLNSALCAVTTVFVGLLLSGISHDDDAKRQAIFGNLLLGLVSLLVTVLVWQNLATTLVLISVNLLATAIAVYKNPAEDTVFKFAGSEEGGFKDLIRKMNTRYIARMIVGLSIVALAARIGVHGFFLLDAASFIIMLYIVASMPEAKTTSSSTGASIRDQINYAKERPAFIGMLLLLALQNGCGFIIFSLLPELTKNVDIYGTTMAFAGLGSILSGFLTKTLLYRKPGHAFLLFATSGILGTLPLALVFLSPLKDWTVIGVSYLMANLIGTISVFLTDYRCQRDERTILAFRLYFIFFAGISQIIRLAIAYTLLPFLGVRGTIGWCALATCIFSAVILYTWKESFQKELKMPATF